MFVHLIVKHFVNCVTQLLYVSLKGGFIEGGEVYEMQEDSISPVSSNVYVYTEGSVLVLGSCTLTHSSLARVTAADCTDTRWNKPALQYSLNLIFHLTQVILKMKKR